MIAKYLQSETVADLFYVTCFCSVYAWILIKYKLHFDFLVVFTPLLRPCQLLYHVSLLEPAFLFFVLSGRPLPVIIIIIIITLFESQIILAEHECCTNWGDCKSNKSNQIKSNVGF